MNNRSSIVSHPQDRSLALYQQAAASHQRGQLAQARLLYEQILASHPRHQGALYLAGTLAFQQGRWTEAVQLLTRARAVDPTHVPTRINLAMVHSRQNQHDAALSTIAEAIQLAPHSAAALSTQVAIQTKAGQYEAALRGVDALLAQGRESPDLRLNQGIALMELGQYEQAESSFVRCAELAPAQWKPRHHRIQTLLKRNLFDRALALCDELLATHADVAEIHAAKGMALVGLRRFQLAASCLGSAYRMSPQASYCVNLANCLIELRRYQDALTTINRGIERDPNYAPLYAAAGHALAMQGDHESALLNFAHFLDSQGPNNQILVAKAASLIRLQRRAEAIATLEQVDASHTDFGLSYLIGQQSLIGEWTQLDERIRLLHTLIEEDRVAVAPFAILGVVDDPGLILKATRKYVQQSHPSGRTSCQPDHPAHDRIRIGYFSADFHEHATSYLMAEVFESHDKRRFETYAFSFGPTENDAMTERLKKAFDHFYYVKGTTDREIIELARSLQIDIAVDLKGFTQDARFGLFAEGCAPIQVNYLGYPGTAGADCIDYIIADDVVIPPSERVHYSERVVSLPDSYQCNDSKRPISARRYSRSELGLPEHGFVFASFNNNYKILPETFRSWMNILRAVDNSVLWLFRSTDESAVNFQRHAAASGIDPSRLVFAEHMPLSEHLARLRQADLFLDTFPYNAHTTASDALWAGLPVLTRTGRSFQSRVAASLLHCIGLPELVTSSVAEYEALAIRLAQDRSLLDAIRQRLDSVRMNSPLFNGARFTLHLEQAYEQMYARYRDKLPPDHIRVAPIPAATLVCAS